MNENIIKQVRQAIAQILEIPVAKVTPDSCLGKDLGADSMDYIEIQYRLEKEFGIEFHHGSTVDVLSEVVNRPISNDDYQLTAFGAHVLRRRMPELDSAQLQEGMSVMEIEPQMTPKTFTRVIQEIIDARPDVCPHCASERLAIYRPSLLSCEACGKEIQCPNGRACLTGWAMLPDQLGAARDGGTSGAG